MPARRASAPSPGVFRLMPPNVSGRGRLASNSTMDSAIVSSIDLWLVRNTTGRVRSKPAMCSSCSASTSISGSWLLRAAARYSAIAISRVNGVCRAAISCR